MKSLAILYPGCIEFEIMLACEILNKNFPVDVATPDGSDHKGSNGMKLKSNMSFEEVDPFKYKVILCPGGAPASVIGNQKLNQILQDGYKNKSILAAICAGPVMLEQAGLLNGRKIAHGYAGPQKDWLMSNGYFKSTTLTDEQCIVDGNIVTARPDAFIDFAVEVAILAGCVTSDKGENLKNYYRGLNKDFHKIEKVNQ
jgi:4-methyl-5(b-hydroxyethyl)-thiazole monophosphate biosynthesis